MMELLVKNRRKSRRETLSLTGKFSKGKFSFTGKKSRIFPTFPQREKVGDLPRFSLGKKKVLP